MMKSYLRGKRSQTFLFRAKRLLHLSESDLRFSVETGAASRTHLTADPKHAAENTCIGPFAPFTIISEYFTNLIV